jgi:hypothetical protein
MELFPAGEGQGSRVGNVITSNWCRRDRADGVVTRSNMCRKGKVLRVQVKNTGEKANRTFAGE